MCFGLKCKWTNYWSALAETDWNETLETMESVKCTDRFIEEAMVRVLILLVRTVVEAVAERAVVNAAEPAAPVRPGTREPFHVVRGPGTLWQQKYIRKYIYTNIIIYMWTGDLGHSGKKS